MNPPPFSRVSAMTLIELLVVMGVIGILMTISINGISKSREQARFKEAVNTVVDFIQGARSRALSNLSMNIGGQDYSADAFYVQINGNDINLYADFNGATNDQLLDHATVDPSVQIAPNPSDLERMVYSAPMGELEFFYTDGSSDNEIILTLTSAGNPFEQKIFLSEVARVPELVK